MDECHQFEACDSGQRSDRPGALRDPSVLEMHQKAYEAASEEERRLAQAQAERFLKSAERR